MTPDTIRVLKNVFELLHKGSYPGQHVLIVHECLQFVAQLISDAEKDLNAKSEALTDVPAQAE